MITQNYRHWFATSYGTPQTRGNGSNVATWAHDGNHVMYTKVAPGSLSAWEFQVNRPDTDHFNCDANRS